MLGSVHFRPWLGWSGLIIAIGILTGMLEPAGVAIAGTINALSYALWSLWLIGAAPPCSALGPTSSQPACAAPRGSSPRGTESQRYLEARDTKEARCGQKRRCPAVVSVCHSILTRPALVFLVGAGDSARLPESRRLPRRHTEHPTATTTSRGPDLRIVRRGRSLRWYFARCGRG